MYLDSCSGLDINVNYQVIIVNYVQHITVFTVILVIDNVGR